MKKVVLSLVLVVLNASVVAKDISIDKAKEIASSFVGTHVPMKAQSVEKSDVLEYCHTFKNGSHNLIHVFNCGDNDGFILVSGDTRAKAILGYSDSGKFDINTLPDNFRYWLQVYQEQIQYAIENNLNEYTEGDDEETNDYISISPLIKTKWGQREPYNAHCPIDLDSGERSVTGCMATAMAQILNYYQWPDKGFGEGKRTLKYDNGEVELYVNFGETEYKWDKMLDEYDENSSQESIDAVAELMLHCGVSCLSSYSSEATSGFVKYSKFRNFKYSYIETPGPIEYDPELIYKELKDKCPVMCSASDHINDVCHAFICDGYSENGYYHMNWGWYGTGDGYYLLSALNPKDKEYQFGNTMLLYGTLLRPDNIVRDVGERIVTDEFYSETYDKNDDMFFLEASLYNRSIEPVNGVLGVKLSCDDKEDVFIESTEEFDFAPYVFFSGFPMHMSDFPHGIYEGAIVFKEAGSSEWETTWKCKKIGVVSDNKFLTFVYRDLVKSTPKIEIKSGELINGNAATVRFSFDVSVASPESHYVEENELNAELYLVNKKGRLILFDTAPLNERVIVAGTDTETIDTEVTFSKPLEDDGEYALFVASLQGKRYSELFSMYYSGVEQISASHTEPVISFQSGKINVEADEEIKTIGIYSVAGQLLFKEDFNDKSVNIEDANLLPGVYIVKVATTKTEKAVKIVVR